MTVLGMSATTSLDEAPSRTIDRCRSCGHAELKLFLDLGVTPLADRLLSRADLLCEELEFPLQVALCEACGLVQITETVEPRILFADKYPYYSSFSPYILAHSHANAQSLISERGLNASSLVIELASNDGYLLKNYVEQGIPVLGIDPADGPAAVARAAGVETLTDFFTLELAHKLAATGHKADVIHANNVLAHVADLNGFVAGVRVLLKDTGVAVIETPYLKTLIDELEFDTIYHEHLCYYSVTALDKLFRRHGLYVNRIQHLKVHGGSLRLHIEPVEDVSRSVAAQLELEAELGLCSLAYFEAFAERVARLQTQLIHMLEELRRDGRSIAAYGAAAKGATLVNVFGIDQNLVDFVVDRNTHKQGKFMPGQHLPIYAPEALVERRPDYVLLLAWNFAEEVVKQQKDYLALGGKFIVPSPEPRVL